MFCTYVGGLAELGVRQEELNTTCYWGIDLMGLFGRGQLWGNISICDFYSGVDSLRKLKLF